MIIRSKIEEALRNQIPIVALESTVISHGMPYPVNVNTALEVERTVSEEGAVPATIGVIQGDIIVGLSEKEIEYLSKAENVLKLSTRDLPLCVAQSRDGATTVSATAFIAEKTNIKVFATGGIGGVHREAIESFDISRDLEELAFRDIIIVSSGAKSILDVRKTVEYLETKDVLVIGYKTEDFPMFYSRTSGIKIPKIENVEDIAKIFFEKRKLGINSAILVANPIPLEYEIPYELDEEWVRIAVEDSRKNKIEGKKVTPFLLSRLFELSKGKTLESNIALIKNNARVAALIAKVVNKNGLD